MSKYCIDCHCGDRTKGDCKCGCHFWEGRGLH